MGSENRVKVKEQVSGIGIQDTLLFVLLGDEV